MNSTLLTILIIFGIIVLFPEVLATIIGVIMITILFIKISKKGAK